MPNTILEDLEDQLITARRNYAHCIKESGCSCYKFVRGNIEKQIALCKPAEVADTLDIQRKEILNINKGIEHESKREVSTAGISGQK